MALTYYVLNYSCMKRTEADLLSVSFTFFPIEFNPINGGAFGKRSGRR